MTSESVLLAILAIEKLLFAGMRIIETLQRENEITDEDLEAERQRRKELMARLHQITKGDSNASSSGT